MILPIILCKVNCSSVVYSKTFPRAQPEFFQRYAQFSKSLQPPLTLQYNVVMRYISTLLLFTRFFARFFIRVLKKVHCFRKIYFKEANRVKRIEEQIIGIFISYYYIFYFRLFQVRTCVTCVQVATPLISQLHFCQTDIYGALKHAFKFSCSFPLPTLFPRRRLNRAWLKSGDII